MKLKWMRSRFPGGSAFIVALVAACGFPLFFPASQGAEIRSLHDFPEIVAEFGGMKFRRDDVLNTLRAGGRISAESSPEEAALWIRREVGEQVWRSLIEKMLADAGITPNKAGALAYLERLDAALPGEGLPGIPTSEFAARAADSDLQLKAALYDYFRRREPEAIRVSDREVAMLYQQERERFLLPAQMGIGVIEIPRSAGREKAETVRARLLQGENFFRVAAEVNPDGAKSSSEEILELLHEVAPGLAAGNVAPVFGNDEYWFVVRVSEKSPVRVISLEEAAPYLREEIAAVKAGRALERKLRDMLSKQPIVFHLNSF